MSDPVVRPADPDDPDDAAALVRIYAHWVEHSVVTFDVEPRTAADWTARLRAAAATGHPVLLAVDPDGTVLGYAGAAGWGSKPGYFWTVEDSVYLAPEAVGRGVGRVLLAALVAALRDAGFRQVVAVIADSGSTASARLHRELGFVPTGRLHGFGWKHGRWIDVDLLQLDLRPGQPPAPSTGSTTAATSDPSSRGDRGPAGSYHL